MKKKYNLSYPLGLITGMVVLTLITTKFDEWSFALIIFTAILHKLTL